MTPADVEGVSFGPVPVLIDSPRIRAYVDATGDDPSRWADVAPPGYAATALFAVASSLLFDPRLDDWTRLLIHGDQAFTWHGPLATGAYAVTGTVDRVRLRQGTAFVTFSATLSHETDDVLQSRSTFLMGTDAPPADRSVEEPDVDAVADNEAGEDRWLRSASRRTLVRYAAATGDFNPIHWDHDRAVAAGLSGIVCHGLLMTAWVNQVVTSATPGRVPLAAAKYRFRSPLRPAEQGVLTWEPSGAERAVELTGDAGTVVSAMLTPRT